MCPRSHGGVAVSVGVFLVSWRRGWCGVRVLSPGGVAGSGDVSWVA